MILSSSIHTILPSNPSCRTGFSEQPTSTRIIVITRPLRSMIHRKSISRKFRGTSEGDFYQMAGCTAFARGLNFFSALWRRGNVVMRKKEAGNGRGQSA